ncbi:MAG TPA: PQQ-dependent catabolism-associated CXXCW motif protein [Patescibacteria group bacterium]|nr:PQQ-dependent catabolism-associated CXXCW motif protein [Patescibacteria group bacterium]
MRLIAACVLACVLVSPAFAEDGYRLDNYRAPTPAALAGARVIDSGEAQALWAAHHAVFVDVLPAVQGAGIHRGQWLPAKPRRDIPGSAWLPNVGAGVLDPEIESYFRTNLARLASDGRTSLVFYCLADCWMSWNAAKRAMAWGYTNVIWYPEGTDGWSQRELPLDDAIPVPLP